MKNTHSYKKNLKEKFKDPTSFSQELLYREAIQVIYKLCMHHFVLGMNKQSRERLLNQYFIKTLNPPTDRMHSMLKHFIKDVNNFQQAYLNNDSVIQYHYKRIEPTCRELYLEIYLYLLKKDMSLIFHEPGFISSSELELFRR